MGFETSLAQLEPIASSTPNQFEKSLNALRKHPTLGGPVRFYFQRREKLLYLVVGAWNTLFGYGVWALLQYLFGPYLPYPVVLVIAWPIVVLNAYLGYRKIVFRSKGRVMTELPRFSLVYLVTLAANLVILPIALQVMPFSIYVIQALFTVVVIISSYLGHKFFSFRGGQV